MSANPRPASRSCPVNQSGQTGTRYNPHMLGGGSVVPYVASWTSETMLDTPVVNRPTGGIAYADETSVDRDEWDVLWVRMTARIGVGRPLFAKLHPLRQRRAMLRMLCQVCGQPAGRTERGHLWLTPEPASGSVEQLEGAPVTLPPVCLPCARLSVRVCPALRPGHVVVRAHSRVRGVSGVRFRPGHPFPQLLDQDEDADRVFDHGTAMVGWVMATQRVRSLYDCVAVNLDRSNSTSY